MPALAALVCLPAGTSYATTSHSPARQCGVVRTGAAPIAGAEVTLYQAGRADGIPQRSITTGGIRRPLGIASDSLGDVWVANSGILAVPCGSDSATDFADAVRNPPPGDRSVTMIGPDGSTPAQPFTNGGLVLPWGVAVDGDDTVWVSNFGGGRLVHMCGARVSACPPGYRTGQPISPAATGYPSDSLTRNTGVQIDPSGNVWLANNWLTAAVQTNPGGHEMVVFIGLAAPVRTPLLGAPRRP